jgi:hypothetical protein
MKNKGPWAQSNKKMGSIMSLGAIESQDLALKGLFQEPLLVFSGG